VTSLPQDILFKSSSYSELSTLINRAITPKSDTSANKLTSDHITTTPHSSKRVKKNHRRVLVNTVINAIGCGGDEYAGYI